eukprot:3642055-Pleurochrysis_carterae.AAC.1
MSVQPGDLAVRSILAVVRYSMYFVWENNSSLITNIVYYTSRVEVDPYPPRMFMKGQARSPPPAAASRRTPPTADPTLLAGVWHTAHAFTKCQTGCS